MAHRELPSAPPPPEPWWHGLPPGTFRYYPQPSATKRPHSGAWDRAGDWLDGLAAIVGVVLTMAVIGVLVWLFIQGAIDVGTGFYPGESTECVQTPDGWTC